jgi:PAS domain S-box-containing protein
MTYKNNKTSTVIEGEQRLRELAEMLPQTIFEVDLNINFTYTNRYGLESTGYSQEDVDKGLNALELFIPEDRARARQNITEILSGRSLKPNEYTIRRKDGSTFPVLVYTSPIVQDGKPVGLRGVAIDITDRKKIEEIQRRTQQELEARVQERTDELSAANDKLKEKMDHLTTIEKALRESEERYRLVFEQTIIGMYRTTPDGRIIMANPAMIKMMGCSSFDELANIDLEKSGFASDFPRERFKALVEKEGQVIGLESAWIKADGTTLYVRESSKAIRDENGTILYYEGTVEDITQWRQAQEALKKSESKYRGLFENILDGVYQTKPDGSILSANPALVNMLGYDSEKDLLSIKSAKNLYVNPDDRNVLTQKLDKDGELRNVEFRLRRKDGREITVLENARAIIDEKGQISHYEGVLTDITRRKQAEKALQQSEEHFRNFLENLGDIAYAIDTNKNVTYTNKMGEHVVGLPREKIVGKSFLPLFTEKSQETAIDVYERTLKGESPEYELVFTNGRICRFKNEPMKDKEGKITGVFGTARDITNRKKSELELQKAHEQLNATLDALPDLLFDIDIDGRILDFRAPQPELLYIPPEKFLGKKMSEVIPRDAAKVIMAGVKEAAKNGQSQGNIYSLNLKGIVHWFDMSIALKGDPSTPEKRFIAIARDITERRKAEIALRESEERYRLLIDSSDYGITLMDKDGTILMINKAGANNLREKPKNIVGKSVVDILPEMSNEILKRNEKIFKSGKGADFEDLLELAGEKRWFWSNLQVVKDADGNDVGIQIISHDVTTRKHNEELLNQKTEELKNERQALTDKNIALKEILEHIERERQDYKQNICRDIEQVTGSILKRLRAKVGSTGEKDIEILENELKVMLAKDIDIFKDRYDRLTSRESEICDMIRDGKSSKQMSEELNLSILTIQKHREQIRKKLGITNKGINLATYLRSH